MHLLQDFLELIFGKDENYKKEERELFCIISFLILATQKFLKEIIVHLSFFSF